MNNTGFWYQVWYKVWKAPIILMGPINKVFAEALGWEKQSSEENTQAPEMGLHWQEWEKVWCKSLGWSQDKLKELIPYLDKSSKQKGDSCSQEQQSDKVLSIENIQQLYPSSLDSIADRHIALFLFYSLFRSSYRVALQKKQKNNRLNFKNKRWFIYLIFYTILAHILLLCLFVYMYFKLHVSGKALFAIEAFALFIPVMVSIIIGKNLDVHKYQETWSRHTQFQYMREQEMFRFLLHIDPYIIGEDASNVERFVKAILEIEGKNIAKFCENMDTKEKGMLDEVLSIVKKKD